MSRLHASAVSRQGKAVLLIGAAGTGKSTLALELMALGADLLADDAVDLRREGSQITLSCPSSIKGKIEARKVGLLSVPSVDHARLAFIVNLDKTSAGRLAPPEAQMILGVKIPLIRGKGVSGLTAIIWCLLGDGQLWPGSDVSEK